ncbi:hypothetical protein [Pistricoccus aurantiacus]|uniref:hypothetical protein n=1 Tax=Pistricoccus aurantiacus TaxID=1883414 RepID=UPI001FE2BCDF|nr:hypothetical protein [Pistricoccus aurantiacus]
MNAIALILLIAATLGSGLIAGLFCVFSNFMMRALARIPTPAGIAAMQAINRAILNPAFLISSSAPAPPSHCPSSSDGGNSTPPRSPGQSPVARHT